VVVPKMSEDEGIFFYAGACDSKRQYQGEDVCTASGLCPGATSDFCVGLCDDASAVEYQTCIDQCVFICAHVPVSEDSSGVSVSSAVLAGTQFTTLHVHRFEISLFLLSLSLCLVLSLSFYILSISLSAHSGAIVGAVCGAGLLLGSFLYLQKSKDNGEDYIEQRK
jgi:hypothetical protein